MDTTNTRITELAAQIQSDTLELDNYCKTNGLPTPSMSLGAPVALSLPPPIIKCQQGILVASAELQALVAGPLGHITRILSPTVSVSKNKMNISLTATDQYSYSTSSNLQVQNSPFHWV